MNTYLLLVAGLAILVFGADLLVRGAVTLASLARIPPLVVGLTVVAFGTSAPELAVSSVSALKGNGAIALGNVIGSNLFNLLVIAGLCATITPLNVASRLVRRDVPVMILVSGLAFLAAVDGIITRTEGVLMFVSFLVYTVWLVMAGRNEPLDAPDTETRTTWKTGVVSLTQILVGLVGLVFGAQWLVESASTIARSFGVSEMTIGLTIVAAGTSLPELATSIAAALKGQRDIAVGNVVGSNIFNLFTVLAAAAVLAPDGVPVATSVLRFDMVAMVLVALASWPIFLSDAVVSRREGIVMLVIYAGYLAIMIATESGFAIAVNLQLFYVMVCLPLTIVVFCLSAWRTKKTSKGTAL